MLSATREWGLQTTGTCSRSPILVPNLLLLAHSTVSKLVSLTCCESGVEVVEGGVRVAAVQDRTLSASRFLYQLNPSGEKRLKPLICRFDFLYQLALGLIGTAFEARNAKRS